MVFAGEINGLSKLKTRVSNIGDNGTYTFLGLTFTNPFSTVTITGSTNFGIDNFDDGRLCGSPVFLSGLFDHCHHPYQFFVSQVG